MHDSGEDVLVPSPEPPGKRRLALRRRVGQEDRSERRRDCQRHRHRGCQREEEGDRDLREERTGDAFEEEERQGGEGHDERCVDEGRPHGDRGLERDTRRRPLIPIRALA